MSPSPEPSTTAASVIALFTGTAREIGPTGSGDWWDKPWRTGFHKEPQSGPVWLGYNGFRGDEQADRKNHGGVDKAVCVYASEHYGGWRSELALPDLPLGAFGENLATAGLVESGLCIGDTFLVGEARVQVSQPRQPCWKLARRWRIEDLALRVERTGRTGFYFRVLQHGWVRAGDRFIAGERLFPHWTVARCNHLMHHAKDDLEGARELAGCPALSGSWKDSLWNRATRPAPPVPGR
jgi:MOSC domain-containing protein YiiM